MSVISTPEQQTSATNAPKQPPKRSWFGLARVKSRLSKSLALAPVAQLVDHLRTPLYRNGYALIFSSFTSAGLGMIFWMLAARLYPASAVGLNSAGLSSMQFLSNIAQFNMVNALNRFVPTAGNRTARLVGATYLVVTLAALVAAVIFVVGTDLWSPALNYLKSNALLGLWFIFSVMTWCVFVLQDSTLTGLRQAMWVPVENIFFAVLKIVLLAVFAIFLPAYGVFASWTAAAAITLIPVNFLIFRRLIPRHVKSSKHATESVSVGQITGYVAGNYVGSMAWQATISLLPIMVIERVGASANAYYYLAWTTAYSLYLMSRNMGMSLITEAATDPRMLNAYSRKVFAQTARMLVPVVAVTVIGAPYILRLFGSDYAAEAPGVFRLLALSAIPHTVITLYLSIARVQNRIRMIVLVQVVVSILSLTSSYILLGMYGITGIGLALLSAQAAVAFALLLTELRPVWFNDWTINTMIRLLTAPRRLWWRWKLRHHVTSSRTLFEKIRPTLTAPDGVASPLTWHPQKLMRTVTDVTVISLGPDQSPPVAMLKVPQSGAGKESLQKQYGILKQLAAEPRLNGWADLLPVVLAQSEVDGQFYAIERMLRGTNANSLIAHPRIRKTVLKTATHAIAEFHRKTASCVVVGPELLNQWIDNRVAPVRDIYRERPDRSAETERLEKLVTELRSKLAEKTVMVSWIHGDYTPGNILVSPDGTQLTGILDWDQSSPQELPQLDQVQLLISIRMRAEMVELGHVVAELLDRENWTPDELALQADVADGLTRDSIDTRTIVLLTWLHHVGSVLNKSERYKHHRFWISRNVEAVLSQL